MVEEDDDDGSVVQGNWTRKIGYITECDIDARWILYYPNDSRPQGSLRIVSHPDLPPGHLRSFVSLVVKRKPKTKEDLVKTFEQYGLLDDNNDIFFFNNTFYKSKVVNTFYYYDGITYKNKIIKIENKKTYISYTEPFNAGNFIYNKIFVQTPIKNDEFTIIIYSEPYNDTEIKELLISLSGELEAYSIDENVETWDTETTDTMRNLEKLYNVKIFE